jgi:hypothetical protein
MSLRPTRLGLLVPANVDGVSWMTVFDAALAAHTRFWGASGNLIFPLTDDLGEQEVFWALADRFDADAFVTYAPTRAEMREFAPAAYEAVMSSLKNKAEKLEIGPDGLEDFLEEATRQIAFNEQPTDDQLDLLNARLAPFHHDGDANWLYHFNATQDVGWPFTDALDFVKRPGAIRNPAAPGGVARQLLLTATVGRVPPALAPVLAERGVNVTDETLARGYDWARIVVDRARGERRIYPWAIGDESLAPYQSGPLRTPAAVVVGDSPWDFALYYALKRMTGMAWWLPSWLQRDQTYLLELGSALEFEPRREGRDATIISASSETIRDRVASAMPELTGRQLAIEAADWRDVLPEEPLRLYERDNEGRTELVQLLDSETVDLRTPLPGRVGTETPAEMRWLTEIRGYHWTPIRHRSLGTTLVHGMFTNSDLVRTTRDGVGYFSPGGVLISAGASLESVVARPTLQPLTVLEQVRAILEPQGWTCEPSDKGIYANESMRLFGGFDELCGALRDPGIRSVIEAYRAQDKDAPGPRLSSDSRRYLLWEHFEQLLDAKPVAAIIDRMLSQGVLRRGLVLKCRRCRQAAWYSAGAVGERFECGRCHLEQVPDRRSWFGFDEPRWSYRLAEVLYQFLEQNGELALFAVHDEFEDSNRPLAHGFELQLTPPDGKGVEVDIFSADGYRLWIGEAKTSGRFESGRLPFIAELASLLDAYGVLLATSAARWPPATRDEAQSAFTDFWPRLRMVEGVRTTP